MPAHQQQFPAAPLPNLPEWQVSATTTGLVVGGDFYDSSTSMGVGSVWSSATYRQCVPAALVRPYHSILERSPAPGGPRASGTRNDLLSADIREMFVTCLYMVLGPRPAVVYANAGHKPALRSDR